MPSQVASKGSKTDAILPWKKVALKLIEDQEIHLEINDGNTDPMKMHKLESVHLMNLANKQGFVLGTGDLSEIALGWTPLRSYEYV